MVGNITGQLTRVSDRSHSELFLALTDVGLATAHHRRLNKISLVPHLLLAVAASAIIRGERAMEASESTDLQVWHVFRYVVI